MVSGALSSEEGGQKSVQQVIPKSETDRKAFRDAQKEYKKKLERAGSRSWQKYCSEVDSLSDTARLCRVLQNGTPRQVGPLKTVTGEWAEDATAVLEGLITAHFPDAQVEAPRPSPVPGARRCDWAIAKKIVTLERLRWAISTFEPYKAPGSDGIYPVLLQKRMRFCRVVSLHVAESLPGHGLCARLLSRSLGGVYTQGGASSSRISEGLQT